MCKNAENGAKLLMLTKQMVEKWHGATALQARASCTRLCWPVACGTTLANHGHARWPVIRCDRMGNARGQQWRALGAWCNGWIEPL